MYVFFKRLVMFIYISEIKSHMAQAGFEITMSQGLHFSPEPPAPISQVSLPPYVTWNIDMFQTFVCQTFREALPIRRH